MHWRDRRSTTRGEIRVSAACPTARQGALSPGVRDEPTDEIPDEHSLPLTRGYWFARLLARTTRGSARLLGRLSKLVLRAFALVGALLLRPVARVAAVLLALPALVLTGLWLALGLSSWTGAMATGSLIVLAALSGFGRSAPRIGGVFLLGLTLFFGSPLLRLAFASGSPRLQLIELPADKDTRLVNRLFPEPDGCLVAAALLKLKGGLEDEEGPQLGAILASAYDRMDVSAAAQPTPAIATYLGLQTPEAFDTIVIPPPNGPERPHGAVVFLHGYAGNFFVYCWEIAQAAGAAGLLTVCPSLGPDGAWWTERGDQTYVEVARHLRQRGVRHVYLAGLSNGGAGASVIGLKHHLDLSGLILISGVRANRAPPRVPTLVIQGSRDRMMGPARARRYAAQTKGVALRELPGGHLIFLSQHERVRSLIENFLSEREQANKQ